MLSCASFGVTVTFAFVVSVEPSGYLTVTGILTLVFGSASAGGVAVTLPVFGSTSTVQPVGTSLGPSNCVPVGSSGSFVCGTSTG